MGYEVRIYIGKVHDAFGEPTFQTMAMVDIRKPGYESATYALCKGPQSGIAVGLYLGDVKVRMDRYDDPLVAIDADTAMIALYDDAVNDEHHPLFHVALTTLRIVAKHYPNTKVVLFGY